MNTVPPTYSDPEWCWPFRKFSLKHEDLFTTLHDRFNTQTLPLQDLPAFHSDVCELVLECDTLDEFYSALEKRKEQRIKELRTAWKDIAGTITVRPAVMACRVCYEDDHGDTERPPGSQNDTRIERWWSFIQYARTPSFDNIVAFFDGYVRDERKNRFAKWTGRRRRPAIEGNPSTATPGTAEAAEEHNQPESSRKASPEAPTASMSSGAPSDQRRTSSSGRHHEAQEGLTQAYKQIDRLCEFVKVEAIVANDAKDLFRLMDKYKIMQDNPQEAVIDGCIFLACRQHKESRADQILFEYLNADREKVKKVVEQFHDFQQRFPHAEVAEEHDKPESTRKTSPEAPSDSQPASSRGRRYEGQEGLTKAYKMIKGLCEEFVNVEATVVDDAQDLFRFMDKYKMMNGHSEDAVLYGCIFLACRKHNVPRTFSEIFSWLNANKTEVRRVAKQFQDFLQKFPHVEDEDAAQRPVQTAEGSATRESTNEEDAHGSRRSWRQVMSESVWLSDMEEHDQPESSPKAPISSREQHYEAYRKIDEFCEIINAGEVISNKAKDIFRYVDEHKILKDFRQENIIGACLSTACRIHKVSQKFKEIYYSTNLDMVEVTSAAYLLEQPKFPFMKDESAGDSDAQEHNKPESSRKVSPGAPSNKSQPTSWKGHHYEAYKEIDALCEAINAGANVSRSAKDIFRLIDRRKFTNDKPQEAVIAICVFVACRQQDVRRTLEEVLRHTRTSKEEAVRVFEQFRDFVYSLEDAEAESAPEIPVETSTAGKRTNDEDAQKRRRVMSESDGDSDTERRATSRDKSKAGEAMPTSKRAEKRKRPDDSEDEARDKRPRTSYSPVPDLFQVPDSPIRGQPDGYASSTDPWASSSDSRESSPGGLSPIAVLHDDASDMTNWQWPRKKTRMPGPSASGLASSVSGQSPPVQHLGTVDASQALPRGGAEQPPIKDTPADAVDSKRSKGKSRVIRQHRVDKRRSRREQETSSPQKQPLQKSRRERKASPSVDQVVRSKRSSRRDTRQKLLFLDEDGTPCVAAYKREI
ncbi:hypothetical protein THAR02_08437 [Trichoderma harzianum]|uniref:Cyclin-like domain-containing protein n=1 Tax=Trichoderma harzianum TaxID=5544 RepID=A0A0G0A2E9_TRIHA|nr:hypothetical protein THAR02_08437 [Trichoderma harzianum]